MSRNTERPGAMTEEEAREAVAAWLSRDYHEELDPRMDISPIIDHVAAVDAWLTQERERISAIDAADTTAEQARVDSLPRSRRLVTVKPTEPFTLNGVQHMSMVTHRTPIECWHPEVGDPVKSGEWGREVTHGTVVHVTRGKSAPCLCHLSAIYEVTDEWQPHRWSGLTTTEVRKA